MKTFYWKAMLFIVLFFACISENVLATRITTSGSISSNTTWSVDTVFINGNLTVNNGVTLTINAGTQIIFQGHYGLFIQGRLLAQGTPSSKITFTAANIANGWSGIRFISTPSTNDTSFITSCMILYGKANTGTAEDQMGGGIFVKSFSKVVIRNSMISNCYATRYGGAITLSDASPVIINNIICNNTAISIGGGIRLQNNSNAQIINNTIVNNHCNSNSGGIDINNSTPVIKNCIIWGNTVGYSDPQIYPSGYNNVSYSDVEGGWTGKGNINFNPDFISPSSVSGYGTKGFTADWGLNSTTPCKNGGAISLSNYSPILDFSGNIRVDYDTIEMGANELIQSDILCGTISTSTTLSKFVIVTCDVTVNNGVTLTIPQGAKLKFMGSYRMNINGRLVSVGSYDKLIRFNAVFPDKPWKGIRFENTATTNDTSKIEYCVLENSYTTGAGTYDNYGGAILSVNVSKLIIRNNYLTNNRAQNFGGAIACIGASPYIVSNLIANNTAVSGNGGGIYLFNNNSYVINNTITRNSCSNSNGNGVYVNGGSPLFRNNIIWRNSYTGGANINQIYPGTGLNVQYCDVEGGVYSGTGGVTTGNVSSDPSFKSVSAGSGYTYDGLSPNWALQSTSTLINAGTPTIAGYNLSSLDIEGRTRAHGTIDPGAFEDVSSINVCGTITTNTTWNATTVHVTCDITVEDGITLTIAAGTKVVFDNYYILRVKGRLLAEGTATDSIKFFALNSSIGWGGIRYDSQAFFNNNNDTSKFKYCRFEHGKMNPNPSLWTSYYAGAFFVNSYGKIFITNSLFTNNKSTLGYSGGALAVHSSSPIILNCTFTHNSSPGNGGAVSLFSYNGIFENCKITNNSAVNNGGGMYIQGFNSSKIVNTLIANNTANLGGGVALNGDNPQTFINCTFSNNSGNYGGAIACESNSDPVLKSCILWSNSAGTAGNEIYLQDVASDPKIYYSDIQGGTAAFGGLGSGANYSNIYQNNLNINPNFISPSTSDGNGSGAAYNGLAANWRIAQGSPCINLGTPTSTNSDMPAYDLDGNERIYNGRVDIGAYENQQDILACGTISSNQTWEADTIKVNCDVIIANGATLSISPGTYVQFQGPYKIEVSGSLVAVGTVNNMITFSIKDTNYFTNMDSFNRGGWKGIQFNSVATSNDSSKLVYCKINHGKVSGSVFNYQNGGALYIYNTNKLLISHCIITNNLAAYLGGAIYLESSNPRILNNIISNNSTAKTSTYQNYTGAIYMNDASPDFFNNTVTNNKGYMNGGLMLNGSSPSIKNCIFYNNISEFYQSYNNAYADIITFGSSQPNISNCIFTSVSTVQSGSINNFQYILYGDPLFNAPSAGVGANYNGLSADWTLTSNTPCLNAGTPSSTSLKLASDDLSGNPRIKGDTIDMGAYEIQIHPRFLTSQPSPVTACVGTKATFSVSASISVAYQWQKSGVNITGATGKTLTLNSVTEADSGYYRCILSNQNGNIVSDSAKLTVRTAPIITTHPNPTSNACLGSSVDFTVVATGSTPLAYQWYNLNGSVSGGANPTYTLNPVLSTSASTYYSTVINSCGSATSNGATLTINTPVTVNPITSLNSICVGNTVSLSTLGSGTAPITYQWYKNGTAISGATNFTYQITNAQTSDAGNYYCKATNVCRSDSTNTSVLVVNTPPSITYQSAADSVCAGQNKTFIISASSSLPITYQWYYGNTTNAITGATNNIYNINSVIPSNSGTYYCKATNTCGTETTTPIYFTVKNPPSITSQSSNQVLCIGQQANFSVTATGTAPLTYKWYKDNTFITGAVNSSYQISSVTTSDAGNYYCVITNSCGSTTSSVKELTVNTAPSIASQSASDSVCFGQSKSFSITASGSAPLSYQWYYNTTSNAISGATNNFYTINSVNTSNGGAYYCKVTNSCGDATTSQINLTIKTAPSITTQSSNLVLCLAQQANFSVTATGTAPITYAWYKDNALISGAVSSTYTISSVSSSDAGNYYCIITNSCGSIVSSTKMLTVNVSPSIVSQSLSDSVCAGQTKALSITATGSSPITYQWYYNSTSNAIVGAVNNIYTINSVGNNNAGSYYCKATNVCGSATTSQITLTVKTSPTISAQSSGAIRCVGQSQNFSVTASSSPAPKYQWFKDDVAITGATNNTYAISVVAVSDAGNYYCLISNSCGYIQSSIKSLTVNTEPVITSQTPATTKCAGQGITLDVKTTGTTPMTYQWFHMGNALNGEVNSFYTIYNIEPVDSGSYYCIATNVCGSDQSGNILLNVNSPVTIYKQSRDTSKCVGDATLFNVQVRGTFPVSYAWYFEEDSIAGAHNSNFYLSSLQQTNTGNYFCKISNVCGTIDGAFKELIVRPLPIVHLGNDTTFCLGGSIDLSADGPYYCKWNTGSTKQNLNVKHSGTFYVYVTDPYGCSNYSDTIDVTVHEPYPSQILCVVTVDPATGKNLIAWEKVRGYRIASFNIYKETSQAGVYQKIASVPFDSLSVVIDYNSNPRKKSDKYAITVVDSCGNESDYSPYHKSIHLTANKGTSGENNLIWTHYEGFNFNTYKIYRGTKPYNMSLLDSVASDVTTFSDLKPPAGVAYYQISAIKLDTCYPDITRAKTNSGPYSQSVSNLKDYTQLASLYISASPLESYVGWKEGSAAIFNIYTNLSTWDASTTAGWLTLEKDLSNNILQALASENYSAQPRFDTIRITGQDVSPQSVVVYQDGTTAIIENNPDIHLMVYPNPFNYSTNIEYELRNEADVRIEVYNMIGARVATIIDQHQLPAKYNFTFDDASTDGIYIMRISVNNDTFIKKLIKTE